MFVRFRPFLFCIEETLGVLWVVLVICAAVMNYVALTQDQWLGETPKAPGIGHFGLWSYCTYSTPLQVERSVWCVGRLSEFASSISSAASVATVLATLATCTCMLCVACLPMFCFLHPAVVYKLCAILLAISGASLSLSALVFPWGWSADVVRAVCGQRAGLYDWADCSGRWTMWLAVVAAGTCLALAAAAMRLSRVSSCRQMAPVSSSHHKTDATRSMHLRPVMVLSQHDAVSSCARATGPHCRPPLSLVYSPASMSLYS